jgi:hypothetical protein
MLMMTTLLLSSWFKIMMLLYFTTLLLLVRGSVSFSSSLNTECECKSHYFKLRLPITISHCHYHPLLLVKCRSTCKCQSTAVHLQGWRAGWVGHGWGGGWGTYHDGGWSRSGDRTPEKFRSEGWEDGWQLEDSDQQIGCGLLKGRLHRPAPPAPPAHSIPSPS